jgi:ubiquinone/menaquinone biosynthesis C-methylase UbiE
MSITANSVICDPAAAARALPDFGQIKSRQQAVWASGDFAIIGTTLQIVGEELCEALDLRAGQRVLDVAAGNGNAALAAARRWCDVTASDYVPAMLDRVRERAAGDRLKLQTRIADAECLPFEDASFDVAMSTFGAMFTPQHERPADEMLRVVRSGGKIGLANWTPDGFIGALFKVIGRYVPPPAGMKSPALWGTRAYLNELFGHKAVILKAEVRDFNFRYLSADHWLEVFRAYYGPVLKTFEAMDPKLRPALEADIKALIATFNTAHDGAMVVPGAYLEVVIQKN